MRVSQFYNLGRTQPSLDFVDVDLAGDTELFISPRAIRLLPGLWGDECVALIQSFFGAVVDRIRNGRSNEALQLLRVLREPNETHLGLSRGRARGRGLGHQRAEDVWNSFSRSGAVRSGILADLEDTVLMIEGISTDIVSDVTTNIIREPLIRYTQQVCAYHQIPIQQDVASGPVWDARAEMWRDSFVSLPLPDNEKLLLVPKEIVRVDLDYDVNKYYRHYILEHLKQLELDANSELVHLLKDGRRRVTKESVKIKYGSGKAMITRHTTENPEILEKYKLANASPSKPLNHKDFAEIENGDPPDWDGLLAAVTNVAPGNPEADAYEKSVEALLSALFYPVLAHPQRQTEIHQGRKRIDITYSNMATRGFFSWLSQHYPSSHIFIECKNYGREIGNPELDQMANRFSINRGKFGVIVCRSLRDRGLFEQRCRDTAVDGHGFIIVLDDEDLKLLVESRRADANFFELRIFRQRFQALVM